MASQSLLISHMLIWLHLSIKLVPCVIVYVMRMTCDDTPPLHVSPCWFLIMSCCFYKPLGVSYCVFLWFVHVWESLLCFVSLVVKCQLRSRVCVGTLCHLLAWGVVPLVPHGRVVGAFQPLGYSLWFFMRGCGFFSL